ncbi:TPA: hypothetical protein SAL96_000959 [Campylobacter jejuni]|uniref:hypothetical protein n=1 Tax=Campylobacter jejuni TaxID=197 RepID=UPI00069A992F|nr:hypothetical protein [Campylobacter jejuni]ECL3346667.1 hypothetical protein [Campylobacter jejuni]ECQ1232056.1 hypothetical protein [Campylobacter jejuni]HED7555505.1 hypothetical protein [Campylobacter jejuni]HEF4881396.1 hypothetical protein [Campylobacter jejuni]HEF4897616.1 hypothetical protein [Campylobacter jejuni]
MNKAVNMKLKITFIVFLVLILTNIGILFISKNEIFTKTLIGLIATAFILYYALAWIKTIKSIKKDSSKSGVKNLFIGILKLPYELVKVVFRVPKMILIVILTEFDYFLGYFSDKFKNKKQNNYDNFDDIDNIINNARAIGGNAVTKIGNTTFIGGDMVTKIGNNTFVGEI